MWHSESGTFRQKNASTSHIAPQQRPTLLKRTLSFQFLNKDAEAIDKRTRDYIKLRYKDISKHVIWPCCRIEGPIIKRLPVPVPLEPTEPRDPRAVLYKADMEDERTPYLAATINDVLRSDSEDSSDDEEVVRMTRL